MPFPLQFSFVISYLLDNDRQNEIIVQSAYLEKITYYHSICH